MSAEDYFDPLEGGENEEHDDTPLFCKRCGKGPFTWVHTGERWRLVGEDRKLHVCGGAPINLSDFDG